MYTYVYMYTVYVILHVHAHVGGYTCCTETKLRLAFTYPFTCAHIIHTKAISVVTMVHRHQRATHTHIGSTNDPTAISSWFNFVLMTGANAQFHFTWFRAVRMHT